MRDLLIGFLLDLERLLIELVLNPGQVLLVVRFFLARTSQNLLFLFLQAKDLFLELFGGLCKGFL